MSCRLPSTRPGSHHRVHGGGVHRGPRQGDGHSLQQSAHVLVCNKTGGWQTDQAPEGASGCVTWTGTCGIGFLTVRSHQSTSKLDNYSAVFGAVGVHMS